MKRVLLIVSGASNPQVADVYGGMDAWFRDSMPSDLAFTVVRPWNDEPLPDVADFDGVLITGSPLSVRDEAAWMARTGAWAVAAAETTPVLGVCFGHQLLGEALGGRVEVNPAGPERGTYEVQLTEAGAADPLFEGLPVTLVVQQLHGDTVVRLPEGAVALAQNSKGQQGFALGNIRTVQFHPELRAEVIAMLLSVRGQPGTVRDTPMGPRILANWVRAWLG